MSSDVDGLKKSLDLSVEWCREWGVKIYYVQKSGIMHVRKKSVRRCNVSYVVDGEETLYVSMCKYLSCVVDEHLALNEMVEDKAAIGRRILGAWLHHYQ